MGIVNLALTTVVVVATSLVVARADAQAALAGPAPATAAPSQQPAPMDSANVAEATAGLVAKLKKLVAVEDWKGAHELLRQQSKHGPLPAGFEWNYFSSSLEDAATRPDDAVWQKRGRAKAAQLLGLHRVAMKQFELLFAIAENDQRRYEARHGKAMSGWWAAVEVVAAGEYQDAVPLLDAMRDFGDSWVKETGQAKGQLVRRLAAAPANVDLRIEFAQKFWGENVPALGRHDEHARTLLTETLRLNPSEKQKLQLCRLIQLYSQQLGDAATAQQYAEQIIKESDPGSEACDEAVFTLSQFFLHNQQLEKSRDWLVRVADSGRQNRYVSMAQLGLAEVYRDLKDEAAMVRWLKRAAEAPTVPTNRSLMDASDTRQTALTRLGKHFQAKGQHETALGYFRQMKPGSWCGNCAAQMQYDRDLSIAECLVPLGRNDEALRQHLMPYLTDNRQAMLYSSARIPALVVQIHETQGTLDQLVKQLKPSAEEGPRSMAAMARDLARIRLWKRDGMIDRLIGQLCRADSFVPSIREPRDNWRAPAAATALSELGGKEFPALKKHYATLSARATKSPDLAEIGARLWVLYAIGLSQAAESRPFLQQLLKTAQLPDGMRQVGASADDLRFIVSLREGKDKP